MELIAVYIKNYKNIKEELFNFSNNYWVEKSENKDEFEIFDLSRENLPNEIKKHKHTHLINDYSIRAIIGKNGSGKSGILDSIINKNKYLHKLEEIDEKSFNEKDIKTMYKNKDFYNRENFEPFCIFKDKNKLYYSVYAEIKEICKNDKFLLENNNIYGIIENTIDKEKPKSMEELEKKLKEKGFNKNQIYIRDMQGKFFNIREYIQEKNGIIRHIQDGLSTNIGNLLKHYENFYETFNENSNSNFTDFKFKFNADKIKKVIINEEKTQIINKITNNTLLFYKMISETQISLSPLDCVNIFIKIIVSLDVEDIDNIEKYNDKFKYIYDFKFIEYLIDNLDNEKKDPDKFISSYNFIRRFLKHCDDNKVKKDINTIDYKYIEDFLNEYDEKDNKDNKDNKDFKFFKDKFKNLSCLFNKPQIPIYTDANKCINDILIPIDKFSDKENPDDFSPNKFTNYKDFYKDNHKIEIPEELPDNIEEMIVIDFVSKRDNNEEILFSNLSDGEQNLIKLFADMFNVVADKKANVILLDEPLNSFHPEWQREFIYLLNNFIENLPNKYKHIKNIIITSHSPFIISDLVDEETIFLDRYKEEYKEEYKKECIELRFDIKEGDCIQKKPSIKTFGTNIHTLLANSFFMDSTIGKFADEKIKKVVNLLKNDKLSKNKLSNDDIKKIRNILNLLDKDNIIKSLLEDKLDTRSVK
ncbi:MAG: hypothetical protein Ta2D_12250 [Rickettsiales bacterium]|nr:MAG: hypothetical protein Ta2D_12250 [Rickettsiales bacterium]